MMQDEKLAASQPVLNLAKSCGALQHATCLFPHQLWVHEWGTSDAAVPASPCIKIRDYQDITCWPLHRPASGTHQIMDCHASLASLSREKTYYELQRRRQPTSAASASCVGLQSSYGCKMLCALTLTCRRACLRSSERLQLSNQQHNEWATTRTVTRADLSKHIRLRIAQARHYVEVVACANTSPRQIEQP